MIVDDEPDVLKLLNKRLSEVGYEVIEAQSGNEAIAKAKGQQPDLIILDIIMPDMDGAKTAEVLQSEPLTKNIPVIFLTCLLTKEEEEGKIGKIIGGKYFIAKPYNPNELIEAITKHIGRWNQAKRDA